MRRQAVVFTAIWLFAIFSVTNGFQLGFWQWLMTFNQWDTRWYGTIAMSGHGFLPQSFVFPPGHSWILGGLTDLTYYAFRSSGVLVKWMMIFSLYGLILNTLAFSASNWILVTLSEKRFGLSGWRMWLIVFSNPMGYFALTAYSDMLFLFLTLCILVFTLHGSPRAKSWKLENFLNHYSIKTKTLILTFLLAIAPWFRLTGAAFASLALLRRKEVLGTIVGVGGFLTYYWIRTDDPFFFLKAQRVFQMPEGHFGNGLVYAISVFLEGLKFDGEKLFLSRDFGFLLYWVDFGLLPLGALLLSFALIFWLAKRREWELVLILFAITLISHNQAMWRSTVRYAILVYPLMAWTWLAKDSYVQKLAQSKVHLNRLPAVLTGLALGFGFALQIFFARVFQSGGWAF
jgi:hypothetical protein